MARTGQPPRYAGVIDKPNPPATSDDDRIVAVGLLTRRDLAMLGKRFERAFPVNSADDDFTHLLEAIDAADQRRRNTSR